MQYYYTSHKLDLINLPSKLKTIDSPPEQIFISGADLNKLVVNSPSVAIVGSRRPTAYGKEVTATLSRELATKGITIVSGLAFGVDSIAHQACISVGGKTIAVLPSALNNIYPKSHRNLAEDILAKGGCLISEYPEASEIFKNNFIARNRLVAGLSDIIIVTEAAESSGTLHTANFGLAQNKTVMAVPGSIFSPYSKGTNNLIKAGALPLTDVSDVLFKLGISSSQKTQIIASSPEEYIILELLNSGIRDGFILQKTSKLAPQVFNQTLTMLEINGQISALGNNMWAISK